jgi:hypothetical protein
MVNHHKQRPSKPEMPYIDQLNRNTFRVNYGAARGSRAFTTQTEAESDLVNYLNMRIEGMAREMFELTRLKRKVLS